MKSLKKYFLLLGPIGLFIIFTYTVITYQPGGWHLIVFSLSAIGILGFWIYYLLRIIGDDTLEGNQKLFDVFLMILCWVILQPFLWNKYFRN